MDFVENPPSVVGKLKSAYPRLVPHADIKSVGLPSLHSSEIVITDHSPAYRGDCEDLIWPWQAMYAVHLDAVGN